MARTTLLAACALAALLAAACSDFKMPVFWRELSPEEKAQHEAQEKRAAEYEDYLQVARGDKLTWSGNSVAYAISFLEVQTCTSVGRITATLESGDRMNFDYGFVSERGRRRMIVQARNQAGAANANKILPVTAAQVDPTDRSGRQIFVAYRCS